MVKKIAIFGSTGSIGKNAIEVVKNDLENFQIEVLIAKSDAKTLAEQINFLKPKYGVIEDETKLEILRELVEFKDCEIIAGRKNVEEIAKRKCDLVISAIMGFAGLKPTLNAIKAGCDIAIANKESLVCGGEIMMNEAKKSGSKIIPVDSEHNAIFQVFERQNLENINDIILTASGGPFFKSEKKFSEISIEEALNHPKWEMGAKISIDSATMMNKGLEMIEAFRLFPIKKEQIKVLVHPQSIVHGFVNYDDGSSLAMLGLPDMKTPLAYAMSYPKRMEISHEKLDLAQISRLDFFDVDEEKFRALKLCKNAMEEDGNMPILLNAANEIAVERFLNKEIRFDQITQIVETVLNKAEAKNVKSLDEIIGFDLMGRELARKF